MRQPQFPIQKAPVPGFGETKLSHAQGLVQALCLAGTLHTPLLLVPHRESAPWTHLGDQCIPLCGKAPSCFQTCSSRTQHSGDRPCCEVFARSAGLALRDNFLKEELLGPWVPPGTVSNVWETDQECLIWLLGSTAQCPAFAPRPHSPGSGGWWEVPGQAGTPASAGHMTPQKLQGQGVISEGC